MQIQDLEVEIRLKKEEATNCARESDAKRSELSRLSSSKMAIHQCQLEFENADRTYNEFFELYNSKTIELKKSTKDITEQIRDLQEKITSDGQLLQDLSLHRNEIAGLEGSLKQLKSDSDLIASEISTIYLSNRDVFSNYSEFYLDLEEYKEIPKHPEQLEGLINILNNKTIDAQKCLSETVNELSKVKSIVMTNESLLAQYKTRHQQLTQKVDDLQFKKLGLDNIVTKLNTIITHRLLSHYEPLSKQTDINDILTYVKNMESDVKEVLLLHKSNKIFLKRFGRAKIGNNCPCCEQSMDSNIQRKYEDNIKKLFSIGETQEVSSEELKGIITQCSSIVKEVEDLVLVLTPLQSCVEEMKAEQLKINDLDEQCISLRSSISSTDSISKKYERSSQVYLKAHRELSEVFVRWQTMIKKSSELNERKKRQSQSMMSFDLGNRSMTELEHTQQYRMIEKDELQVKKDRLFNEENNLTKRLYSLKAIVSDCEKALNEAKMSGARHSELENLLSTFQSRLDELDRRVSILNVQKGQVEREFHEKQKILMKGKSDLQEQEELAKGKVAVIKADRDAFNKIIESLDDLERRLQSSNINDVTSKLESTMNAIDSKEQQIKELHVLINTLTTELASQEHTRWNIQANIDVRTNSKELKLLQEQLLILQQQDEDNHNGANRIRQIEANIARTQRQVQTLLSSRDNLLGKLEIYVNQVKELRSKLNTETYRGIQERHRRKSIEYETTLLAISDLDSYFHAL